MRPWSNIVAPPPIHRPMKTAPAFKLLLGSALALVLTGCSTTAPSNLPRLRASPEYEDALRCAPNFTTDALKTIADLEAKQK